MGELSYNTIKLFVKFIQFFLMSDFIIQLWKIIKPKYLIHSMKLIFLLHNLTQLSFINGFLLFETLCNMIYST